MPKPHMRIISEHAVYAERDEILQHMAQRENEGSDKDALIWGLKAALDAVRKQSGFSKVTRVH
jgi:hypothetical protein